MLDESNSNSGSQPGGIEKQSGVTASERYLEQVAGKTFLSMWSYPTVYRDQGKGGDGHGKEIADLLVVFGNDVIIFSDKDVAFPDGVGLDLRWGRWHRRAVVGGAQQVWGAERWLRSHPDRVFLDRACTTPFPLHLPVPPDARYHLIVVAHGASGRCRAELGGSGSLMWVPQSAPTANSPFTITDLDPTKTFVHVLDDTSLEILLRECDTIADFTAYLQKKEAVLRSGRFIVSAGEEELVALYLKEVNEAGEHDFPFRNAEAAFIAEGEYSEFTTNPQRLRKARADRASAIWDELIERFAKNILGHTLYSSTTPEILSHERGLRVLASENRVRRRMLGGGLLGLLADAHKEQKLRYTRVIEPSVSTDPYYVFLLLKYDPTFMPSHDEYRQVRQQLLLEYCRVLRLERENAHTIVGIALDVPTDEPGGSEDLLVYDAREFSPEERAAAKLARAQLGLFKQVRRSATVVSEYPDERPRHPVWMPRRGGRFPGTGRNDACPCGSKEPGGRTRKYKKCCGP